MIKLYGARSLLYRRQILQENIRWKALDEIYKIYMFLHRSDLNSSANFRRFFGVIKIRNAKKRKEKEEMLKVRFFQISSSASPAHRPLFYIFSKYHSQPSLACPACQPN